MMPAPLMSLAPGTRLGPYEILTPIGAGGTGEVYRARDAKLNRRRAEDSVRRIRHGSRSAGTLPA
jgi:hypothetical protein